MQEEIEIRHSACRPIDRDETKYQTDIIATSCIWKENLETSHSLEQSPIADQTYFVFLKQPVKFSLNMKLWLFYNCPIASYNGYEKEEEIEQARFCFGAITKIISYDASGATVEFTVLKTLTLQDILETTEIKELPESWTDFFITSINDDDYSLETIGNYFQLSASIAQGDMGQFCLFTEYENTYTICLFNEWLVSEDATFGGKYKLPESIGKLLLEKK